MAALLIHLKVFIKNVFSINERYSQSLSGETPFATNRTNLLQFDAMQLALSLKEGFALIQGPPGTGKTQTSLRILNALHLQHKMIYYETFTKEANYINTFKREAVRSSPPPPRKAKLNLLV